MVNLKNQETSREWIWILLCNCQLFCVHVFCTQYLLLRISNFNLRVTVCDQFIYGTGQVGLVEQSGTVCARLDLHGWIRDFAMQDVDTVFGTRE